MPMDVSTKSPTTPTNPARPAEIEEWWNARIIHPLSGRIADLLVPTFVTPNQVSVAGAVLIASAGFAYGLSLWPWSVALGLFLHISWNVMDGVDGDLARRTGRASPFGEIVDGLCDYGGHIVLYVTLAVIMSRTWGAWAWVWASASGASRIVQANHYETLRRTYIWRVHGGSWLRRTRAETGLGDGRSILARIADLLAGAYVALSGALSRDAVRVDEVFASLADNPPALEVARNLNRQSEVGPIRIAGGLSADVRTVVLGLSMLAGGPVCFFLYETVALNAFTAWSVFDQGRRNRLLLRRIAELGAT